MQLIEDIRMFTRGHKTFYVIFIIIEVSRIRAENYRQ